MFIRIAWFEWILMINNFKIFFFFLYIIITFFSGNLTLVPKTSFILLKGFIFPCIFLNGPAIIYYADFLRCALILFSNLSYSSFIYVFGNLRRGLAIGFTKIFEFYVSTFPSSLFFGKGFSPLNSVLCS